MIFESLAAPLVPPPDNITIPQFILDDVFQHPHKAKRSADIPCLIQEDTAQTVMFPELRARTDALARALVGDNSVGDGDVVAMICPNHIDYPVCVWAVHRLGGTIASMSPGLTKNELVHQLLIAKPALVIAHLISLSVTLDAISSIGLDKPRVVVLDGEKSPSELPFPSIHQLVARGPSRPAFTERLFAAGEAKTRTAFLCFSSGTTGTPKAVLVSHYNVICNVLQTATFNRINEEYSPWEERRFRPGDVCTGVLPFYHIYGLVTNLHYLLYSAMTIVVTQQFNFEKFLASISRHRITHLQIVPPMAVLLSKHPATRKHDLSSVRYCMIAAAPISAELTIQLLEVLPNIHFGQGYGMTEASAAVSMFPISQKIGTLGSAGQLVSGTIAKVVKTDGSLAGVGEPGELWVKGGQVATGYLGDDEATRETFVDGWYRTGDEVLFRKNGDIFVTDRIKEIIKSKGFQVAPAELEGHLLTHPDVADAGVVGVADQYAGEVPLAFIALRPHITAAVAADHDGLVMKAVRESIFKHVSDVKSSYKWLTGGIIFIDAIPKTASGKILRRVLRDQAKTLRAPAHVKL